MPKHELRDYKLLPRAYEKHRLHMSVVDSLKIKGLPNIRRDVGARNELIKSTDVLAKTLVLANKSVSRSERVSFINKIKPHALFEVMALSSGTKVLPGFHQHSKKFRIYVSKVIAQFASFAKTHGLTPVVSWSYDPNTHDRESIQHEKRFHLHMVGRRTRGLQYIIKNLKRFKDISPNRRRRICDEHTLVASTIAYEILQKQRLKACELIEPGTTPLSQVLLQVRIIKGWKGFIYDDLQADIVTIEKTLNKVQKILTKGTTKGHTGIWERPTMRAMKEIRDFVYTNTLGVSTDTQKLLLHFYHQLAKQPHLSDSEIKWQPKDVTTYLYPLAGPAHSVTFSEEDGDVYAYFRPALFSDLGGAGVCIINGAIIKLKKGVGTFSESEVKKRSSFQNSLVKTLIKNVS